MKKIQILQVIFILFALLPVMLILYWLFLSNKQNIDLYDKKELFGNFTLYDNKVYVSVPSNGDYLMSQVDQKSFHAISDKYIDKHIGIDTNNVHCGNRIIPNMNPKTTKALGNNYYSDGKITYYCGAGTVRNSHLKWHDELYQTLKYDLFDGKKPQTWLYPMRALPQSDIPYYPILDHSAATNGKQVYYDGKPMSKANPQTLHRLKLYLHDSADEWRESDFYLGDGKNVYFKDRLLPLSDDESLYSIRNKGKFSALDLYLFDPRDGMVYVNFNYFDDGKYPNTLPFPKQNAPYTLISNADTHTHHTLWKSKNGIFFYDTKEKKVKKAGENPFLGKNFKEIAPLVFSHENETWFIDGYEVWGHHRSPGLRYTHTHISKIDDLPQEPWQEQKKTRFYSIWKKGNDSYYFDNWGSNQLIPHTVYKIVNHDALQRFLTQDEVPRDDISKMIREEKFITPPSTQILDVKTYHRPSWERWFGKWWPWIAVGLIGTSHFLYFVKNRRWRM
ncbi:hypothetical protein CSB09_03670 [Candidatus Gracilibacteria bacterium]|nr:MAG: hypothetical protein CSB09_03670 [Candidatus Gracilibacteria bacterium]